MQPQQLPALIAVITQLERSIYGGATPGEGFLSDQELIDLLQTAGIEHITASAPNFPEAQRLHIDNEVQRLIRAKPSKRSLSIRQNALLQLNGIIFRFLETSCQLHSHAYAVLQGLQAGFAIALVRDPPAILNPEQPHRKLIESLVLAFRGYDQAAGRKAHAVLEEAGKRIAEAVVSSLQEDQIYQRVEQQFSEFLHRYNKGSLIYEKSLITKEHHLAIQNDGRLRVNREIAMAINGRNLPADMLQFFQEVWSKYLYVTYLREGIESEAWNEGIGVIQIVLHCLSVRDPHEMFQLYQGELGQALSILNNGTESILNQDPQLTKNVLEYLHAVPLQIIRGEELDLPEFQPAIPSNQSEAHATPSPNDFKVLEGIALGDWCFIRTGEQCARGKLIHKDTDLGYCLFTNYSGIKAARIEIAGLAAAVGNGSLERLDTSLVIDRALETALTHMETQVERLKRRIALKRQHDEIRREEIEVREREQKAAELQAQERKLAQQQEHQLAIDKALIEVQMFQPGGWLELLTKDNVKHVCKLGLRLKSTQKMIFVDRLGQKVAEMLPDDLAARIVEGSAHIIDYGVAFKDTLQSLIQDRSGKINVE